MMTLWLWLVILALGLLSVFVLAGFFLWFRLWFREQRQQRAAAVQLVRAQPQAQGRPPAPAAATSAGAPVVPDRVGSVLRAGVSIGGIILLGGIIVSAALLALLVVTLPLRELWRPGPVIPTTTAATPSEGAAASIPASTIEIRGPFTPGPSDWTKRNVIRWWEVIMPGNAPGWQPVATEKAIPITQPWRKFVIRHQSGYIETPHGSWPPRTYGWPDPTAESLLSSYPGATAQDLALPSGWLGEIVFRVVNGDGTSRGGNHLWNATVPPYNACIAGGSKRGYFQFTINVPQPMVVEFGKPLEDQRPPNRWIIAPGSDVDRAYQDTVKALLAGDLLLKATPRVDARFVSRNRGHVVFEVVELNEYVPPGTSYPQK